MPMLFAIFGRCNLDFVSHTLRRSGSTVHLTPKAFSLLEMLLERRPAVVSKEEIMERLWPGVFVSEANIPNLIAEIREAIGDKQGSSRLIRTVHRVGYAFGGDAHIVSDDEAPGGETCGCSLVCDGREVPLKEGNNLIGRGDECQVRLSSATVSRRHAQIRVGSGVALIQDLGSKNGTLVAGRKLLDVYRLADGDEIQAGDVQMRFRTFDEARPTQTYVGDQLPNPDAPEPADPLLTTQPLGRRS
jgi:DNA-binding winged helix-turn-helix (wHTH) protein